MEMPFILIEGSEYDEPYLMHNSRSISQEVDGMMGYAFAILAQALLYGISSMMDDRLHDSSRSLQIKTIPNPSLSRHRMAMSVSERLHLEPSSI